MNHHQKLKITSISVYTSEIFPASCYHCACYWIWHVFMTDSIAGPRHILLVERRRWSVLNFYFRRFKYSFILYFYLMTMAICYWYICMVYISVGPWLQNLSIILEVLFRMFISSWKTSGFSQTRAVTQNTLMGSVYTRVKVDVVILDSFSLCAMFVCTVWNIITKFNSWLKVPLECQKLDIKTCLSFKNWIEMTGFSSL